MMKNQWYILQFSVFVNGRDVDMVEFELVNQLHNEKAVKGVTVTKQVWG